MTKLPILTASSTEEWINCTLRAWLPAEASVAGPAAIVGTRFHKLVEAAIVAQQWVTLDVLDEGFEVPLRNILEWMSTSVPQGTMLVEQAYELWPLGGYHSVPGQREPHWRDSMSCRRLDRVGHREYPNVEGRIYGTADLVVIDGTMAHVIDWKTGKKSDSHTSQLKTLALMVAEAEHVSHVKASAVYVNLKSGKVSEHSILLDQFDLHMHAGAVVSLSKRLLQKETPDPNPGKHCFYCPSLGCPEKLRNNR
jgi:hypothetical protein